MSPVVVEAIIKAWGTFGRRLLLKPSQLLHYQNWSFPSKNHFRKYECFDFYKPLILLVHSLTLPHDSL